MRLNLLSGAALAVAAAVIGCGSGGAATPTAPTTTTTTTTTGSSGSGAAGTTNTAGMYSQFGGSVSVTIDASTAVLRTTDIPDHRSPYFGAGHAMYEAPHAGMQVNPHSIAAQNIVLRVPLTPQVSNPSDTPLGPIGVAVNGVVFFNQYAAGRQPLTNEIFSFDRYNGHPAPSNQYHYHFEPTWITSTSKSRLIGVLLDGFPVYGPQDAGGVTPANLDVCNGHVAATPEFPDGLYHYHTTTVVPYIAGCYRGVPGTMGM